MAMRHPRIIVLCGAFSALAVMSLLSAVLGHILPALLPRRYTTVAAAGLFFVFGGMMLKEGLEMPSGSEKIQEELREVQKEVEDAEEKTSSTTSTARRLEEAEEGNILSPIIQSLASPTSSSSRISLTNRRGHSRGESKDKDFKASVSNVTQLFIHPILAQTFFMTFLAEWGDRSQISTIALAAAHVCLKLLFPLISPLLMFRRLIECVCSYSRNYPRPFHLHSYCRPRRPLSRQQNLYKERNAWWGCVILGIRVSLYV